MAGGNSFVASYNGHGMRTSARPKRFVGVRFHPALGGLRLSGGSAYPAPTPPPPESPRRRLTVLLRALAEAPELRLRVLVGEECLDRAVTGVVTTDLPD